MTPVTIPTVEWVYVEFGRRLSSARQRAGLRQETLAKRVGLTRTSITNIEKGNQRLPLHMAYLLSAAVGLDPKDLLPTRAETQLTAGVLKQLTALPKDEQEWVRQIVGESPAPARKRS